jgi:hypothetical protein
MFVAVCGFDRRVVYECYYIQYDTNACYVFGISTLFANPYSEKSLEICTIYQQHKFGTFYLSSSFHFSSMYEFALSTTTNDTHWCKIKDAAGEHTNGINDGFRQYSRKCRRTIEPNFICRRIIFYFLSLSRQRYLQCSQYKDALTVM